MIVSHSISPSTRFSIIDIKTLDQYIPDQVYTGEGEINGRVLTVIFENEASKQFSEDMEVYLSWKHRNIPNKYGYDVFTKVDDKPLTYQLYYSPSMLHKGVVLARIELVDKISVTPSRNFLINILSNPAMSDEELEESTEFSILQKNIAETRKMLEEANDLAEETQDLVEDLHEDVNNKLNEVDSKLESMNTEINNRFYNIETTLKWGVV